MLIDGCDTRTIAADSLHHQMGIVLQHNFLFTGTVLDNIRVGRPEASDAEVVAAVEKLDCLDLFEGLTDGFADGGGRARRAIVAGSAATRLFRAGHAGRSADSHSRRGDELGRYADRSADSGGLAQAARGAHQFRRGAPSEHDSRRRSGSRARSGTDRRTRNPSRARRARGTYAGLSRQFLESSSGRRS